MNIFETCLLVNFVFKTEHMSDRLDLQSYIRVLVDIINSNDNTSYT